MSYSLVKKSASLITVVVFLKILGFLKQTIIAWKYGTGSGIDVYLAADGYMNTISLILMTAIPPAIVTLYLKIKKEEERSKFISSVLLFMIIIGLGLVLINILLSPLLSGLLGISYTQPQHADLRKYLMILSLMILFACISSVASGLLQSKQKFIPDKLLGLFISLGMIAAVLIFGSQLGADALLIGFVVGYLIFAAMMIILLLRNSKIKRVSLRKNATLRKFLKIVFPLIIGVCVVDFSHLIDRIIASSLDPGSVSSLYYSQIICGDLINGIIINPVGVVLLPRLTMYSQKKAVKQLAETIRRVFRVMIPVVLFMTILYIVVGKQFISVAFERGEFTAESTNVVYSCVLGYSVGLVFILVKEIISRFFYSHGDTKTPMISNLVGVVLNILLSVMMSRQFGVQGIAYATSISVVASNIILIIRMKKYLKKEKIVTKDFMTDVLKNIIILLSVAILGFLVGKIDCLNPFASLCVGAALMMAVFVVFSILLKTDVGKEIKYRIWKILGKKHVTLAKTDK